MNSIDLLVLLMLVFAIYTGWKQGFILQLCSLASIVAGIYLASRFGVEAGRLLQLDAEIAAAGGFVVVLLATVLVIAVAAYLVRGLFRFAGFGLPDRILGIAVSVLKYLLLLSVLFSAFAKLNEDYTLVKAQTIENSKTYKPVMHISETLCPFLEWAELHISQQKK